MKQKMIVITDCAFGIPFTDPDDALALWHLVHRPHVQVVGIVTTFGNVSESLVYRSTRRLLEILGHDDIPVIRQAVGSTFLIKKLQTFPHQITVLNLGPLSVISEALKEDRKVAPLWKRLVIMGGCGNARPFGWPIIREERNFRKDMQSTRNVLKHSKPQLVTLEQTQRVHWRLKEISVLPERMRAHLKFWLWLNRLAGRKGFSPHDLTAAQVATKNV